MPVHVERRPFDLDVETERDVDVDRPEQQPDSDADPSLGVHVDVKVEGIEEDDAVAADVERRVGRAELRGGVQAGAGHDRFRAEGEVDATTHADLVGRLPAEADAGHLGIAVVVEARVIAADSDHELSGVRALPPGLEREPAGETDGLVEQPRVVGELGLDEDQPFLLREASQQGELDRDQGEDRRRQLGPGQPEDRDLETVAELDGHQDLAGDQHEAGEADAASDPELALLGRDDRPHVLQLLHGRRRRTDRPKREHERVGVDLVDRRRVELAVDAEADADPGDEERRHPADRRVQHPEGEERRELRTVRRGRVGVAAEQVQTVAAKADLEHAQVLDAAGRRGERELGQAAREAERTEVGCDREPVNVDFPRLGREDRLGDVVGEPQVVDGRSQAEQRDLTRQVQADDLELARRQILPVAGA